MLVWYNVLTDIYDVSMRHSPLPSYWLRFLDAFSENDSNVECWRWW